MSTTLPYCSPTTGRSAWPLVAMIAGIMSGPVAFGLAAAALYISQGPALPLITLIGTLTAASAFSLGVLRSRASRSHAGVCTVIGFLAPIAWGIAICWYLYYKMDGMC